MIVAPKINCRPSFVIDTKSLQVKKMVMRCHGHHVIKSFCKTAKSKKQSKNESMKQVIQCIWFIRSVCAHQIFANHVLQQNFLSWRWKAAVFKTRVELALLCLATLSKRIKNHLGFEHPKNKRPSFSDAGGDFFPARQPCEDHKSRIYWVATNRPRIWTRSTKSRHSNSKSESKSSHKLSQTTRMQSLFDKINFLVLWKNRNSLITPNAANLWTSTLFQWAEKFNFLSI